MGCDIHMCAERQNSAGGWFYVDTEHLDSHRSYALFSWLAGVRNYSKVTPLALPRGFPFDASTETEARYNHNIQNVHTPHWYLLDELLVVDYEQPVEVGECSVQTLRGFIGSWFIASLPLLKADGVERIVFWFDN